MREQVLENYGVRVTPTLGGVCYALPWVKDTGMKETRWVGVLFGVVPCVMAGFLPVVAWRYVLPGAPGFAVVFFGIWAVVWWLMVACFTCLFGAMAWSGFSKWGLARIWVSGSRIAAVQLRGAGESRIAYVRMSRIKGFSTVVDGDDRGNAATPGRLLVDLDNNVSRLLGGYPLELLEALREDLEVRLKGLRVD